MKLKAHFKNKKNKILSPKDDRFKKVANENCIPTNNHHSIGTFIEATCNEIQEKVRRSKNSIQEWKAM